MKTLADLVNPFTKDQRQILREFFHLTGYGPSDLLSLSYETGIFLTRGGGKYKLENGKIQDIDGPPSDPEERM